MPITRTDTNEITRDGVVIGSTSVVVDITAGTVERNTLTTSRQAFVANRTYLAIAAPTNAQVVAQVRALTRQNQGLIRLVARDLLTDETID